MTEAETADFRKLASDKAFLAFLYRMIRDAGLFTVAASGPDARSLEFVEGRRSLALDILRQIESVQSSKSPDGLPVMTSIQIFVAAAQLATKEKSVGGRNDIYGDISDGDGDGD